MSEILRYSAFTDSPEAGNPAGVVLDAQGLSSEQMQQIAAEVGYSETAFITASDAQRHTVRYFSPSIEIPFCGHATIATGIALAERDGPGEIVFATPVGEVAVQTAGTTEDEQIFASLLSVPGHSRLASAEQVERTLAALGWSAADLHPDWPAHVAFAGNDHLTLGAISRERLADLDYDFEALASVMHEYGWPTIQLFWVESPKLVHARDPFAPGGVVEDPATGSAAAAFGAYLQELGRAPERLTIIQGEDMGRRSELIVDIEPGNPQVRVSGTAARIP